MRKIKPPILAAIYSTGKGLHKAGVMNQTTLRGRVDRLCALSMRRANKKKGPGSMTNEAFSRVKIDAQLRTLGWEIDNFNSVRFEVVLGDGTRADYVFCDRYGRAWQC